jgi:hypothetical protein
MQVLRQASSCDSLALFAKLVQMIWANGCQVLSLGPHTLVAQGLTPHTSSSRPHTLLAQGLIH